MAKTGHSVTILTSTGDIVPNAPIEIRLYSTGLLASIYEQDGTPITQTGATADENGIFRFWAEPDEYFARHGGVDVPVTVAVDYLTLSRREYSVKTTTEAYASNLSEGQVLKIIDRGYADFEVINAGTTPLVDLPDGFGIIEMEGGLAIRHMMSSSVISIAEFGAVGDGVTGNRMAMINARDRLYNAHGGGVIRVPSGEFMIGGAPFVLKYSNMTLEGVGADSVLINDVAGSPWGDCVHIGLGREWDGDLPSAGPPYSFVSATRDQMESGVYSHIRVRNTHVKNLTVKSTHQTDQGMGIWMLNALNCTASYIYGDNVSTPVNIANDGFENPTSTQISAQEACANCHASHIYSINGGKWYDIAFIGAAYKCSVSYGYVNPESPSDLDAAVALGGSKRCIVESLNAAGNFSGGKNYVGVEFTGPLGDSGQNVVQNCDLAQFNRAVVSFSQNDNVIIGNSFPVNDVAIDLYSSGNKILNNDFDGPNTHIKINDGSRNNVISGNAGLTKNSVNLNTFVKNDQLWLSNQGYNGEGHELVLAAGGWNVSPSEFGSVLHRATGMITLTTSGATLYREVKMEDSKNGFGMSNITSLSFHTYAHSVGDTYELTVRGFSRTPTNNTVGTVIHAETVIVSGSGDQTFSFNLGSLDVSSFSSVTLEMRSTPVNQNTQLRVGKMGFDLGGTR